LPEIKRRGTTNGLGLTVRNDRRCLGSFSYSNDGSKELRLNPAWATTVCVPAARLLLSGLATGAAASSAKRLPLNSRRAPDDFTADVSTGRCAHASAVNHVHTRAACLAHLRDQAVRLMKGREGGGLRRCCDAHGEDNGDQPDHCFLLLGNDGERLASEESANALVL